MMRTSELTGLLLDYWVARAEGDMVCTFSSVWSLGGKIIEKNAIHLIAPGKGDKDWFAFIDDDFDLEDGYTRGICGHGPTPLVAAMRAYVASKFGDEVQEGSESNG